MTNAVRQSSDNPDCPRAPDDVIRDLRVKLAVARQEVEDLRVWAEKAEAELAALAAARLALQQENAELKERLARGGKQA